MRAHSIPSIILRRCHLHATSAYAIVISSCAIHVCHAPPCIYQPLSNDCAHVPHTTVSVTYGVGVHDRGGVTELGRLRRRAVEAKLLLHTRDTFRHTSRPSGLNNDVFMVSDSLVPEISCCDEILFPQLVRARPSPQLQFPLLNGGHATLDLAVLQTCAAANDRLMACYHGRCHE